MIKIPPKRITIYSLLLVALAAIVFLSMAIDGIHGTATGVSMMLFFIACPPAVLVIAIFKAFSGTRWITGLWIPIFIIVNFIYWESLYRGFLKIKAVIQKN